jgi:HSP20 family protein
VRELDDVHASYRAEIEQVFRVYKDLEGLPTHTAGFDDRCKALRLWQATRPADAPDGAQGHLPHPQVRHARQGRCELSGRGASRTRARTRTASIRRLPNDCGGWQMAVQERRSVPTPERFEPAQSFEQVAERMRRLLDESFGGVMPRLGDAAAWIPPVDIEENEDAYVLEAEVPGVKRGDVNIELVGRELMISGEIKEKERTGVLRRRTRRTGRFEYRVVLPADVSSEKVDARLDDGVLTVRIPKAEKQQRRKIEVKS